MDSDARDSLDTKAEFRKPSNDATNRKYRRRSPVGRPSSSSDGSPHGDRSSSPVLSRKNTTKVADDKRKRDDSRRPSDRHSARGHHRNDEHSRRDRHLDDYDRGYSKPSYHSGKDHRSRDYVNDVDSYSHVHRARDKDSYDRVGYRDRHRDDRGDRYGRTDHRKSFGDHKGDQDHRSPAYEETRAKRASGQRLKESSFRGVKETDGNVETKRYEDQDLSKEQGADDASNKSQDCVSKKAKVFSMDSTGTSEKASVTDSDVDAAKIAAMKAAELVNKNLVGTGYMSTDQKKKLLWGNKKNTAPEESVHRWDATTFGDRDRQEKFNKLMGVKGAAKVDTTNKQDNNNPDVEKQREQLQMELERQYTAGLRRRDGRTVGLGL
ncbi:hypothetical protein CASFOL_019434 [Castilleja foliolosa]|uniref:Small acidic protein-like domain-containing protein n=1 Tax=Castilleja foliolosa TaxID=1961234 RepID=A0ABD3D895_9LAMI